MILLSLSCLLKPLSYHHLVIFNKERKLGEYFWFLCEILAVLNVFIFIVGCFYGFYRVKEMITFFDKTIAKRTPLGQRQSVQNQGSYSFLFRFDRFFFFLSLFANPFLFLLKQTIQNTLFMCI